MTEFEFFHTCHVSQKNVKCYSNYKSYSLRCREWFHTIGMRKEKNLKAVECGHYQSSGHVQYEVI